MRQSQIRLPIQDPEHPYNTDNGRYRFPHLQGVNLFGDTVLLPPTGEAGVHIMLTVFQQELLFEMKHWLGIFQHLHEQYEHTQLPVHSDMLLILDPPPIAGDVAAFAQALGDIQDTDIKNNAILVYYDSLYVRSRLAIHKKADSAIVLLDHNGNIIWKDTGLFTADCVEQLKIILEDLADSHA